MQKLIFVSNLDVIPGTVKVDSRLIGSRPKADVKHTIDLFNKGLIPTLYATRGFLTGWRSAVCTHKCEVYFIGDFSETEKMQGVSRLLPPMLCKCVVPHQYCCDKFREHTGKYNEGFEFIDGWHVNGCCGGGCYVLSDLKFCPFCGKVLTEPKKLGGKHEG